ncbi:hypothetical protein BD309DRAFT_990113 [Dichomitus squalens]|uniref:Uncharacterized protein n=1 Tax=Dichomitus squalens TaxID=114155 RepID=A0A4Q9PYZ9_9APHY|nr:uncharacterized protein DICSQDRAFT_153402 [Dichomitus squalens LYAD-421 SS1]EJF64349.1 hypothetical protein DICSQDRAFT_153402 [Dichomitus squalens LYAD-421 SS1]TBU24184.1 hypothetical protein BD311DRAFT_781170 [Dichomitus squalens]TBU44679.1 hypothetical protein BD309DRAFT_990113 [Dichomitus squalens]TBU59554.1 hypothetical protein BD310DRAFT_947958 [Dichomitus squalens]
MGRDAPAQTESEMRSPSHRATDSEDVTQLSSSVVQALQEEIAALRGMLSSSVVRIVHRQSSISDVLPQYEPRQDTSQEME